MPPSGYNAPQADSIKSFLVSCSQALRLEAHANKESLSEALDRELQSIEGYLSDTQPTAAQDAVLRMTYEFYSFLRQEDVSQNFEKAVDAAANKICSQVLAIHIDPPLRKIA